MLFSWSNDPLGFVFLHADKYICELVHFACCVQSCKRVCTTVTETRMWLKAWPLSTCKSDRNMSWVPTIFCSTLKKNQQIRLLLSDERTPHLRGSVPHSGAHTWICINVLPCCFNININNAVTNITRHAPGRWRCKLLFEYRWSGMTSSSINEEASTKSPTSCNHGTRHPRLTESRG